MSEINNNITHLDRQGNASMVDVTAKAVTTREAVASCVVRVGPRAMQALVDRKVPKGDVYSTARIAGILGAKKVDDLIPLCHPLPLSFIAIDFEVIPHESCIKIMARAKTDAKTGVEMEAMTAVTIAALTIYDMLKGLDKGIVITDARLEYKSGGKSGAWTRRSTQPQS